MVPVCALVIGLAAFVAAFNVRRAGADVGEWQLKDLAFAAVAALVVARLFVAAAR